MPDFRNARMAMFHHALERIPKPLSILDLGGTKEFWVEHGIPRDCNVHMINPCEEQIAGALPPRLTSEVGTGCKVSHANHSFGLVFSNSAIGHVGGLRDQIAMADEIRRLAPWYWVQTPNKWFPLDWQTLVPFFHWLPNPVRAWCYAHFRVGRCGKAPSIATAVWRSKAIRNLTRKELQAMFPDGRFYQERFCGLVKSFTVSRWP
jgi:hypothetical protein